MDLPHFERASRRAFLRRGLAASGALAAAGVALAACSKSDADVFSAATADETTTTGTAAATATTTAPVATASSSSTSTSTTAAVAETAVAAGALEVSFSYTAADSSGRVRNPYVAVWVEDDGGDLVALIGVWYSTRDAKYLRELTEFTAAATDLGADQVDAVSGATRTAGRYQLQWDGRGLDGTAVAGPHTLWVEAAREHGPHSVTSGSLTLPATGPTTIAGNGELSEVAVTVV